MMMIPIIVIQAMIKITAPIKYKKEIMFTHPIFPHELNYIFRIQGRECPVNRKMFALVVVLRASIDSSIAADLFASRATKIP